MATIGVLALQGDFSAHRAAFGKLGVEAREVRRVSQLRDLRGLVIPGGESTTLLNLMRDEPWFESLRAFESSGGALLGTCAGAILLAREVLDPAQPCLGMLDATVRRNAWGRQVDSFETWLEVEGWERPLEAVFIRAPKFVRLGSGVEVLASLDGEPVLVRQGRVMAATFHPELTTDRRLQQEFLALAVGGEREESRRESEDQESAADLAQLRRVTC
jgi:5'-phosphate synthase pdxT subunit